MNTLISKTFWLNAGERAVATFAQTLGALIGLAGVGAVPSAVTWDVDVKAAAVAGLLSLLKSLSSVTPIVPSIVNAAASALTQPDIPDTAPAADTTAIVSNLVNKSSVVLPTGPTSPATVSPAPAPAPITVNAPAPAASPFPSTQTVPTITPLAA